MSPNDPKQDYLRWLEKTHELDKLVELLQANNHRSKRSIPQQVRTKMWVYAKSHLRSLSTWKLFGSLFIGLFTWLLTLVQLNFKNLLGSLTLAQQSVLILPAFIMFFFLGFSLLKGKVRQKMSDPSNVTYFSMDVFVEDKEFYWKALRPLVDDQTGISFQKTRNVLENQLSEKEKQQWKNRLDKEKRKYKELEERKYTEAKGIYNVLQNLIVMFRIQMDATGRMMLHINEKIKNSKPISLTDLDIAGAFHLYTWDDERITFIQSVRMKETVTKRKQIEMEAEVLAMKEKRVLNSYRKNRLILLFDKNRQTYVFEIHIKEYLHLFKKDTQQYMIDFIYHQMSLLLEIIEEKTTYN